MITLILILVCGGILAGLVNYFVIIKNLKFIEPTQEEATALENDEVPPKQGIFARIWQFLREHAVLIGYLIVGIAGALLTPLIHALLTLKGLEDLNQVVDRAADKPEEKVLTPFTQLVLLGYGIVFGVFAVRLLSSVIAPLVSRLSQVVAGQQKEIKALREKAIAPGSQGAVEDLRGAAFEGVLLASGFADVINLPNGGLSNFVKGVDISHHNGKIAWGSLRSAGIEFVYIKISEGYGTNDPRASINASEAKSNGFKFGYYHFGRPDTKIGGTAVSDAKAEAKYVNELITGLPAADLPIMLDLEDVGGSNPWDSPLPAALYYQWVQTFMTDLAFPPTKIPIIYSRKNYLDVKLPGGHTLSIHPLWIALYNVDYKKAVPAKGWDDWKIWQFSETGNIGLAKFDLNIWKRDHFDIVVNNAV